MTAAFQHHRWGADGQRRVPRGARGGEKVAAGETTTAAAKARGKECEFRTVCVPLGAAITGVGVVALQPQFEYDFWNSKC